MRRRILTFFIVSLLILPFTVFSQRINPEDLKYLGAFRLPDYEPYTLSWNYGGTAMTCYPNGDPHGPDDGYPGSLFGTGHDSSLCVAEITIPPPIISLEKNLNDLNTATFLQAFQNIRGDFFLDNGCQPLLDEMIRCGMSYLQAWGEEPEKLHFAWGQHNQFDLIPSHMCCDLKLTNPQPLGPWYFGNYTNFVTNDYLFEIPREWSNQHAPGQRLAAGRYRDGGWSGWGPTLFAYSPWTENQFVASDDTIKAITPLLMYGIPQPGQAELMVDESMMMLNYCHADEWSGGAWLAAGDKSAVVFVGTKGLGDCWYGLPDGSVWEDPYPPDPDNLRGWWAESFQGQIIFYDTSDLAKVAQGILNPWDPQLYAALNIDPYLFNIHSQQQLEHVGAASYDPINHILYVFERRADEDKCLVHAWKVQSETMRVEKTEHVRSFELKPCYPNPFNSRTTISYHISQPSKVKLAVYNLLGQVVDVLVDEKQNANRYSACWDGCDKKGKPVASTIYILHFQAGDFKEQRKVTLIR